MKTVTYTSRHTEEYRGVLRRKQSEQQADSLQQYIGKVRGKAPTSNFSSNRIYQKLSTDPFKLLQTARRRISIKLDNRNHKVTVYPWLDLSIP